MSRPDADTDGSPQARLRREHARAVLRAITAEGTVSRTQLAHDLDLSGQSVGRIARDLLDDGLIEETDMERGAGPGAPRIGLTVRADGAFALGFGLERDRLTGVALDLAGHVRWEMAPTTTSGEPAADTLRRIERQVRALMEGSEWAERRDRICGLGIAAPGPIDLVTGTIVDAPNFPTWQHVDVAAELGRSLGLPVLVDNAATAAAIGTKREARRGPAPFVYCYWGLGIGGGLVVDDEAYRGTTGNAIEIGHVAVMEGGHRCECGATGCLEAEASVAALLRDAAAYGSFATVEEVVAAAEHSAPLRAVLTTAAERMATGLLSVVNLLDVDEVIIGGEHFRAVEQIFLPVIRDRLASSAFRRRIAPTTVTLSPLGEAANAVGAAALVLHSVLPAAPGRRATERPPDLAVARAARRRPAAPPRRAS